MEEALGTGDVLAIERRSVDGGPRRTKINTHVGHFLLECGTIRRKTIEAGIAAAQVGHGFRGMSVSFSTKSANPGDEEPLLPPGQRDGSGFWIPAGYNDPRTLVRRRSRRQRQDAPGQRDGGESTGVR